MYSVEDISATVIEAAWENNQEINATQLQKILYLIQTEYILENKTLLFNEEFEFWSYGPIIKNIWKTYSDSLRLSIHEVRVGHNIKNLLSTKEEIALYKMIETITVNSLKNNIFDIIENINQEIKTINNNPKEINNNSLLTYFL